MPTRYWRSAEPPWRQAAENTNGYYIRTNYRARVVQNRFYLKRGRYIWPIPKQAAENTNGYFLKSPEHKWLRAIRYYQRRGRIIQPPLPQANPLTNGYFLPIVYKQRRIRPPYYRRGEAHEPPWTQAAPVTPKLVFRWGQRRTQPPYTKRTHIWMPPLGQANPLTNGYFCIGIVRTRQQHIVQILRRSRIWAPISSLVDGPFSDGFVRRQSLWLALGVRRRRIDLSWAQVVPPTPLLVFGSGQRRTRPPYYKHGRIWLPIPPQAAVNTNGYFIPLNSQRWLRGGRIWQRRGKFSEIPWGQAISAVNPNLVYRWGQRRTSPPYFKRTHIIQPPWGQAAISSNQPYFVLPSGQKRRQALQQYTRRGKLWLPTPAQVILTNPVFSGWKPRRALRRFWTAPSRGKVIIPGVLLEQAALLVVYSRGVYTADEDVYALYSLEEGVYALYVVEEVQVG